MMSYFMVTLGPAVSASKSRATEEDPELLQSRGTEGRWICICVANL